MLMKGWVLATMLCVAGCQKEPTIVIRFEPSDMKSGVAAKATAKEPLKADAAPGSEVKPATPATPDPCTADKDCVAEPVDPCCDCKAGGQLRAVSVARHAARPKAACKEVMCAQVMSVDPSCAMVAACAAGRCALAEPKAMPATP
jgi:hypothetical protein